MPLPLAPPTAGAPTTGTLATVADLAARTKTTIAADDASALAALYAATGLIQDATGQHLLAVTGDTVILRGGGPGLVLPERPVNDVTAVSSTVGGVTTTHAGTSYERRGDDLWLGLAGTWAAWPAWVTVTYDHGFTTIPRGLVAVCVDLAALRFEGPTGGVIGETQGQWSTQWDRAALTSVLADHSATIRRYRRAAYSLSVA